VFILDYWSVHATTMGPPTQLDTSSSFTHRMNGDWSKLSNDKHSYSIDVFTLNDKLETKWKFDLCFSSQNSTTDLNIITVTVCSVSAINYPFRVKLNLSLTKESTKQVWEGCTADSVAYLKKDTQLVVQLKSKDGGNNYYSYHRPTLHPRSNHGTLQLICKMHTLPPTEADLKASIEREALKRVQPQPLLAILLKSMELCDVILETKDGDLKAHQLVLSGKSTVFHALLKQELKTKDVHRVNMKKFSSKAVREMMSFLYLTQVPNLKTMACELFPLASEYGLEELKEMCLTELHNNLTADNVVSVLLMAHEHSVKNVKDAACDFIRTNYSTLSKTAEWEKMKKHSLLLAEIFG